MKTLTIIIAILGSVVLLNAQTDIIYPAEGGNIIFDCKITEVKNGNNVFYTKDSISKNVIAVAITKDGNYIDLSDYVNKIHRNKQSSVNNDQSHINKEYDRYKTLYQKAKYNEITGAGMTIIGLGSFLIGYTMNLSGKPEYVRISPILTIFGFVSFNVGVPIWISNATKKKNNRQAMESAKTNTNLSLSTTYNGIGLVLSF